MRRATWWLAFGLIVALFVTGVGCSSGDDDDSDDAGDQADDDDIGNGPGEFHYDEPCPDGPEFAYSPSSIYPNDAYLVESEDDPNVQHVQIDTSTTAPVGPFLSSPVTSFMADAVNTLDGFSTLADIYIPTGVEVDPNSLPDEREPGRDDSVFLVRVGGNDYGYQSNSDDYIPVTWQLKGTELHLRPWKPLRENSYY
ncbi:MAG: hypothetical protein IT350_14420, partial [Deltaproteobacteria bacterium]|nr:hypothetical protein [Deltaproteobacteria bacterium]